MILTGETKLDFERWLHSNDVLIKEGIYDDTYLTDVFEELPLNLQYASIIEWFDEIKHPKIQIVRIIWNTWSNSTLSYKETVTEAIKKANEIYNGL